MCIQGKREKKKKSGPQTQGTEYSGKIKSGDDNSIRIQEKKKKKRGGQNWPETGVLKNKSVLGGY